jgi:hypothetical protein
MVSSSGPQLEEKRLCDVALQEPVAILAEEVGTQRVIHTADKPPEQQVVLQLLRQQPFAAQGVTASVICRIGRSGWSAGIRSSGDR